MPVDEAAPLTKISNSILNKDIDAALWAAAKLHLYNIRHGEAGTKDYTNAINGLSKLLVDIKKLSPKETANKEQLIDELKDWIDGDKK